MGLAKWAEPNFDLMIKIIKQAIELGLLHCLIHFSLERAEVVTSKPKSMKKKGSKGQPQAKRQGRKVHLSFSHDFFSSFLTLTASSRGLLG
jgi:hypothetical protein